MPLLHSCACNSSSTAVVRSPSLLTVIDGISSKSPKFESSESLINRESDNTCPSTIGCRRHDNQTCCSSCMSPPYVETPDVSLLDTLRKFDKIRRYSQSALEDNLRHFEQRTQQRVQRQRQRSTATFLEQPSSHTRTMTSILEQPSPSLLKDSVLAKSCRRLTSRVSERVPPADEYIIEVTNIGTQNSDVINGSSSRDLRRPMSGGRPSSDATMNVVSLYSAAIDSLVRSRDSLVPSQTSADRPSSASVTGGRRRESHHVGGRSSTHQGEQSAASQSHPATLDSRTSHSPSQQEIFTVNELLATAANQRVPTTDEYILRVTNIGTYDSDVINSSSSRENRRPMSGSRLSTDVAMRFHSAHITAPDAVIPPRTPVDRSTSSVTATRWRESQLTGCNSVHVCRGVRSSATSAKAPSPPVDDSGTSQSHQQSLTVNELYSTS